MAMHGMRGLSIFVSDIRNCQNKEQERLRVDKELGNIRNRFKKEKVRVFKAFFILFFINLNFGVLEHDRTCFFFFLKFYELQ